MIRVYVGRRDGRPVERSKVVHMKTREAKRAAAQFEADVRNEVPAGAEPGTFDDLLDRWWAHHSGNLEATTRQGYQSKLRRIRRDLGPLRLDEVTPAALDAFYRMLTADKLSASSVRRHHAIVSVALTQAMRWGEIDRNPAARGGATPPKIPKREYDVMPDELAEELLAAAEASDPEFGMLVRFMAETGARRGEACGLRWHRVDLATGNVHLARAVVEVNGVGCVEKDLKTHASRHCALDGFTVGRLTEHRAAMVRRAAEFGVRLLPTAYVFTDDPTGAAPLRPGKVTKAWRSLVDPIADDPDNPRPELRKLHPHDLRHYMATSWLLKGVPMSVVSKRLGHDQESTTANFYSHVTPAADRAAVELVSAARQKAIDSAGTDMRIMDT